MANPAPDPNIYYVPHRSKWPLIGSFGLFLMLAGFANLMNGNKALGMPMTWGGIAVLIFMFFGWFSHVINESVRGLYNRQVDFSFRMGMIWFIFSEIMFFSAFFGALFYARVLSVPWLGGIGDGELTNIYIWSGFESAWPSSGPGQVGGEYGLIGAWGIPLLNTMLLLASGVTLTIAHHALKAAQRTQVLVWLGATVVLGSVFLYFQMYEYVHAYRDLNLTLGSGIYGSTFFMLTGFHGVHVTLGTIMLIVIWFRCLKGHFSKEDHFGFEAVAWYWHFVDVVWLVLFIFVYVL